MPLEHLRFGLSPRAELCDENHVAALAEVVDQVPPIIVHAPTMRVIDGVHRVHAARSIGRATIRAVMFEGDETAAHIEAVRANVAHGKPLTLSEREEAAASILQRMPEWSDRRIAGVSGLSPKTVGRIRQRATVDSPQSRARVGRDGRIRPVDPSQVRRRVAEAIRTDPRASNRAVAKRTGASQATVRDVRDRLLRGDSELPSPRPAGSSHLPASPRPGVANGRGGPAGSSGTSGHSGPAPAIPAMSGQNGTSPVPDVATPEFVAWFTAQRIEDADWEPFVEKIPISRVYEVADACRRYSKSWRAFALALEDRARGHKRSPGGDPAPSGEAP